MTSLRHPRNIELFKIAAFVAPAEHHRHEGQRRKTQYFTFHKQFPLRASLLYPPRQRTTLAGRFNARVAWKYANATC